MDNIQKIDSVSKSQVAQNVNGDMIHTQNIYIDENEDLKFMKYHQLLQDDKKFKKLNASDKQAIIKAKVLEELYNNDLEKYKEFLKLQKRENELRNLKIKNEVEEFELEDIKKRIKILYEKITYK
ncbi:MAG: hypothetical protein KAQ94_02705 [Arcobacteraceae bacterium]|nr:hypothetical protein [Arcobacteraceae bacterium]